MVCLDSRPPRHTRDLRGNQSTFSVTLCTQFSATTHTLSIHTSFCVCMRMLSPLKPYPITICTSQTHSFYSHPHKTATSTALISVYSVVECHMSVGTTTIPFHIYNKTQSRMAKTNKSHWCMTKRFAFTEKVMPSERLFRRCRVCSIALQSDSTLSTRARIICFTNTKSNNNLKQPGCEAYNIYSDDPQSQWLLELWWTRYTQLYSPPRIAKQTNAKDYEIIWRLDLNARRFAQIV